MKRLLPIIVLSFCSLLHAQEIKVKSMELLQSDLTARTNPRLDGNDEPCALIKVIIPAVEGMQFEGWVIGNIQYRPGEYQVYVPAGTKKITFRHPDYLPGEIRFTLPIEGKCTYRVILDPPKKAGGLESVEHGDAAAMLKQAQNYEQGTGSYQKDIGQALIWYEKAAEAGSIEAQEHLAEVLYKGTNGFTKDDNKALLWNEACAKRGQTESMLRTAIFYDNKESIRTAITWYEKYNEQRPDNKIQYRIAQLIGNGTEKNKWLKLAADNGHVDAAYELAIRIAPTDAQTSSFYFQKAVDGNHFKAMYDYGTILLTGKYGFAKDEAKGKCLLDQARTNRNIRTRERAKEKGLLTLEVNGIAFNLVSVKKGQIAHTGNFIDTDFKISELPITCALWNAVMGLEVKESDFNSFISTDFVIWMLNKKYYGNIWEKAEYGGKRDAIVETDMMIFIKKLNELTLKKFRIPELSELKHASYGGGQKRKNGEELGIIYIKGLGDYAKGYRYGYDGMSHEDTGIYGNLLRLVW